MIIRVGSFNDERYFYILSFDRKIENEASVREILEAEIAVRSNIGDEGYVAVTPPVKYARLTHS